MSYLGSALPFTQQMLFANTWLFGGLLKKKLSESNMLNAIIRTTTAPTIIEGGSKDNVLPARAEAVVNFRILPGDDLRSVYQMVLDRIGDDRVQVTPFEGDTLEGESGWDPSPVADTESAYFLRLSRLIRETFPGVLVSPYLVVGGTDARHYASVTENALRFSPVQMGKEDLQRVHGVNERLSFDNCARMVGFYIEYIREIGCLPAEVDALGAEDTDIDEDDLVAYLPLDGLLEPEPMEDVQRTETPEEGDAEG